MHKKGEVLKFFNLSNRSTLLFAGILALGCAFVGENSNAQNAKPKAIKKPMPAKSVVDGAPIVKTAPVKSGVALAPLPTNAPKIDDSASKAIVAKALADATAAKTSDINAAIINWKIAYDNATTDVEGQKAALEAAKYLGYAMLEQRDIRAAEAHFAAETIIARKLYFTGSINAKPLTDAIKHWASASGLMMRSNDSAALVFYAREINARERAALSSQILNREAQFASDSVESIKVDAGTYCAVAAVDYLAKQVSCDDERGARSEALSLQARQIKADAPKPISKEEKAKKESKDEE
jgi:hypothetical protein